MFCSFGLAKAQARFDDFRRKRVVRDDSEACIPFVQWFLNASVLWRKAFDETFQSIHTLRQFFQCIGHYMSLVSGWPQIQRGKSRIT